ncbi:hypothetical protein Dimus_037779 [Dionaea muscipula]
MAEGDFDLGLVDVRIGTEEDASAPGLDLRSGDCLRSQSIQFAKPYPQAAQVDAYQGQEQIDHGQEQAPKNLISDGGTRGLIAAWGSLREQSESAQARNCIRMGAERVSDEPGGLADHEIVMLTRECGCVVGMRPSIAKG